MKAWTIGKPCNLTLDSALVDSTMQVAVTIVGEDGTVASDSSLAPIESRAAVYSDSLQKFALSVTIDPATPPQFLRVMWVATDNAGNQVTIEPSYATEDYRLMPQPGTATVGAEIVPVSWFVDSFIAPDQKRDKAFKDAVTAYVNANYETVREELNAALGRIEFKINTKLFATEDTSDRDWYFEDFRSNFWMIQTNFRPITKVNSYKLAYGAADYSLSDELSKQIMVDKSMGTLEFVPTSLSGNLLTALLQGLTGLGISMLQDGGFARVPLLFRVSYQYGLDFPNLPTPEKSALRFGVARNALIELLPRIDSSMRLPSESKSVDGVSKSRSGGVQKILDDYRKDEKDWVEDVKKRYNLAVNIVVV